jgi:hypothetical protein
MSHRRAGLGRYHTIEIQTGEHVITAADPPPDDVQQVLNAVHARTSAVTGGTLPWGSSLPVIPTQGS